MFLAICKNNLFSCVRGHAPSLCCSNVAATRCPKVWRGATPTWCQKTPSRTSGTYINWHQRLKQKVCSYGRWYRLAHNSSRLDDRKSTLNTASSSHCQGHPKCISATPLPNNQGSFAVLTKKRTDELAPLIWRLSPSVCNHNLQVFHPACLLNLRVPRASLPLHSGARGFSSPNPRKPIEEEVSTVHEPSKDVSCRQDAELQTSQEAAPQTSQHEHFQFKELYENPWTIPNFLCMARILLAPVLGYLIIERYFHISLGLFILAGATDLLDGWIARNWPSQKSALGSALDPLADKILISVLYVSLTYANLIPAPLTALVIFRDIGLIAAVFYVRYKTVPPPVTLSKFFNPCYTTAQLKPTLLSKVNTAIQLLLVAVSVASPVFHYTDSLMLQSLWYITAVTTIASGYTYYHYGRKTVQILNSTK